VLPWRFYDHFSSWPARSLSRHKLLPMTPVFTITNAVTSALTRVERARGFLQAARLSDDWLAGMQQRALVLEAHYSTHIEGTHLTLDQSEKLLAGEALGDEVDPRRRPRTSQLPRSL
jgi:hypothetical protein